MGQRSRAVIGSPQSCRAELEAMAARYEADEVMVLTITGDYEIAPALLRAADGSDGARLMNQGRRDGPRGA